MLFYKREILNSVRNVWVYSRIISRNYWISGQKQSGIDIGISIIIVIVSYRSIAIYIYYATQE